MARGNSTEDERQEVAESLIGLSPREKSIALEKLHSDYTIDEWKDIYSRLMENDPQSQVRYNNPEELELSKMSEEDLLNSIDGIDRGQSDLTDAEQPIVKKWIREELKKRKNPKGEEPKSTDKLDYEVVNDESIDAIKDNFTPPGAEEDVKVEEVDTSAIDEKDSGKSGEDDLDLYMKDLDDYAAKNKKGREDIPATYKR